MDSNNANEKIKQNTKSNINFSEIWHTFITNLVWEILIFVVILSVGFAYSTTVKTTYVASADIVVNATLEDYTINPDNVPLSQRLAPDVAQLVGSPSANAWIGGKYPDFREDINSGFQNAKVKNEGISIILTVNFSHPSKDIARDGIGKYINYFNEYLDEVGPFNKQAKISLGTGDSNQVYPSVSAVSSRNNVILISGIVSVASVCAFVVIAMLVGDKVSNVTRLESVSGIKNLISVGKKQSKTKSKNGEINSSMLVSLNLDKLSDTLIFMQDGESNKVFQIQSTYAGEGKTTITCNLAKAIGRSQRKVLIIDCDFAHPSVHKFLGLSMEIGLSNYAKKTATLEEIIKPTKFENVDLITCGDLITNHTVMFTSVAFANVIKEARAKYDFVLLDCAPVKAMSDYISVSQLVDTTLLVVESDKVKAKDLASAVNELNACGANVVGTIFNCSKVANTRYYYYYYHKKPGVQEEKAEIEE